MHGAGPGYFFPSQGSQDPSKASYPGALGADGSQSLAMASAAGGGAAMGSQGQSPSGGGGSNRARAAAAASKHTEGVVRDLGDGRR